MRVLARIFPCQERVSLLFAQLSDQAEPINVNVAFESKADIDTVADTIFASRSKVWRDKHGGDWHVASYLVPRLCADPRTATPTTLEP